MKNEKKTVDMRTTGKERKFWLFEIQEIFKRISIFIWQ